MAPAAPPSPFAKDMSVLLIAPYLLAEFRLELIGRLAILAEGADLADSLIGSQNGLSFDLNA